MTWIKGVDGSYAALTSAIVGELRGAGVEVWWQCLWTGGQRPPAAIANLEIARAGGMMIAGYCSVTSRNPGWWHAQHAREGVADDLWSALLVVACDVELDGIPNDTIRQCVDRLFDLGKRRAIYTSLDAWTNKQGNPMAFGDCLLCNAYWDGDPDVDFSAHPFGPWRADQVLLEQYTGDTTVSGVVVDRDVWNSELLLAGESGDQMAEVTKGEFGALFSYALTTHAAVIQLAGAVVSLAQHVYGDDEPRLAQLRKDFDAARASMADAQTRATAAAAVNPTPPTPP